MKIKDTIIKAGSTLISDEAYNHIGNYYLHLRKGKIPKFLNLKNPRTFNEKIISYKLNNRFPEGSQLADKYEVRKFVKKTIGAEHLIPLLAVYEDANEIDWNELPQQFVLKASQGSGWNIIVKKKSTLNKEEVEDRLRHWLNTDYSIYGREWQYRVPTRRIVVEKYLENDESKPLLDYKFFCFHGEAKFVQVDIDRMTNHTRNFYDLNWNLMPFGLLYPRSKKTIPKPEKFEKMHILAQKIASALKDKMDFVRIDLYSYESQIYFGEVTFHPEGGCGPFFPQEYDEKLGQLL